MMKIFMSIVFFACALFANESEETYSFTAKGEFAKELKALMEKYEKDGKVEINELKVDESSEGGGIVDALLSGNARKGDVTHGKKLYDARCVSCHGTHADRSTYSNARVLRTLSQDTIEEQLENYRRDSGYGKGSGIVMHQYAVTLNTKDIRSLAAYIKSFDIKSQSSSEITGTKKESKTQGSYLK